MDPDILLHSPILYGRDLLSWNESTHTDVPLLMWHEINNSGENKIIKYSIIFSNEDSRVGLGLADLMFNYGRTTDIEWVYEVTLDANSNIISEIFQGASHTVTNFFGEKIGRHPILKNATLNCNFTDIGISEYKFFLSPHESFNDYLTDSNGENVDVWQTRQVLMDDNPWTYRIMAEELINESRYEEVSNPETLEISDVRNYIYIEYFGSGAGNLDLIIKMHNSCSEYYHTHNLDEFSSFYSGGAARTSIELPENFNPENIQSLGFISHGEGDYDLTVTLSSFFYLDNNYIPIQLPGIFSPVNLDSTIAEHWIPIHENTMNIDCFGNDNGSAECDDCGVCNGNNIDIDECGICFGNNTDMDCAGICFGSSILDDCGVCDSNSSNDNSTCSGCTDINADNFDENAVFYDESCIYSDNIFLVPTEYNSIQNAIFFASDGDTVEVGEGTYQENIHFLEKSIIVRAEPNLEVQPIIMGIDSLSTITIENSMDVSLIGFTITNGYGQGVSFDDFISLAANPSDFDSLITTVLRGGGISIINSAPHLKDLHITGNSARNVGAGIGLINSSVLIESTAIDNNSISEGDALGGGGIAINGGDVTLLDVKISNNFVGSNMYYLNGGGGILCGFSFGDTPLSINMYNTTIIGISANIGGGIGALSGNILMEKTLIANNTGDFGAAISMGEPMGLVISDINMTIMNSTITNNTGMITTGLINSAYLNILNSIFWNNDGSDEFASMPNNDQLNIMGFYSLFVNEFPGEANISLDPIFINSENGNYQLSANSPCIDSGISYYDFGDDLIVEIESYHGVAPDMGAYEFNPHFSCEESLGDINLDGTIDILDIVLISNIIMGFSNPNDNQLCISDMNNDGTLNILDIIIIINVTLN